jgi:TPR repeat protein
LIHPDNKLGVKYILKAAELGNADALDRMARAYQFGELEQEVDLTRSFRYYEKAAERGHVQSMLSLSKMYLDGQAVEINESLAFKWCERSAASGFDHAEFALG